MPRQNTPTKVSIQQLYWKMVLIHTSEIKEWNWKEDNTFLPGHNNEQKFETKERIKATLKNRRRGIQKNFLVYIALSHNLLSATQIIERTGVILLECQGAAMIPSQTYDKIKAQVRHFSSRKN